MATVTCTSIYDAVILLGIVFAFMCAYIMSKVITLHLLAFTECAIALFNSTHTTWQIIKKPPRTTPVFVKNGNYLWTKKQHNVWFVSLWSLGNNNNADTIMKFVLICG